MPALQDVSWFLDARHEAGMSDCVENTQSEIPFPRLRDRNDSVQKGFSPFH
jgi:hypothetical protein